jgi:hypothetical protein
MGTVAVRRWSSRFGKSQIGHRTDIGQLFDQQIQMQEPPFGPGRLDFRIQQSMAVAPLRSPREKDLKGRVDERGGGGGGIDFFTSCPIVPPMKSKVFSQQ